MGYEVTPNDSDEEFATKVTASPTYKENYYLVGPCYFNHAMEDMQLSEVKGFKPKLKGPQNFDEWKYEFKLWARDFHPCVDHYVNGLWLRGHIDDSVKHLYEGIPQDDLNKLMARTDFFILLVLRESIDTNRFSVTWRTYHDMIRNLYQRGERDQVSRNLTQLKAFHRSHGSYKNFRRYELIYTSTPKWLEITDCTINPFRYKDRDIKHMLRELDTAGFEKDYEAACKKDETCRHANEVQHVMVDFHLRIADEIDLHHKDKARQL